MTLEPTQTKGLTVLPTKAQHVEMCRSHREHWERIARETESPDERAEARHQVAYWTRIRREADDWTWPR